MSKMEHVEGDALLYIQPAKLVDEGPDYSPFEVWARYTSDGAAYRVFENLSRDEARVVLKLFSRNCSSGRAVNGNHPYPYGCPFCGGWHFGHRGIGK